MKKGIRIYVGGGGETKKISRPLRIGFQQFLSPLSQAAREKGFEWDVILCGGRQSAYDDFCTALRIHRDSINILLVDAEEAVSQPPWEHLHSRKGDEWSRPAGVPDNRCHLMVQTVEAWLIADPDALVEYYGQHFNRNAIPSRSNVEDVPKADLYIALTQATRNTQKGEYRKIKHCADLLKSIDSTKVRSRASYCERLFTTVLDIIASPSAA